MRSARRIPAHQEREVLVSCCDCVSELADGTGRCGAGSVYFLSCSATACVLRLLLGGAVGAENSHKFDPKSALKQSRSRRVRDNPLALANHPMDEDRELALEAMGEAMRSGKKKIQPAANQGDDCQGGGCYVMRGPK